MRKTPIILVLMSCLLLTISFMKHFENQHIWGDEIEYIKFAHDPDINSLSVLPGFFSLYWQPPLAYGIYSFFSSESLKKHFDGSEVLQENELNIERNLFVEKISYFNILLLFLSGCLIYLITRSLGGGEFFSAMAAGLTILNPRVIFYIQTLWPELIHYVLLLTAVYLFILFSKNKNIFLLILSSLFFAYCIFTKGIVSYYFYFLVVVLAVYSWKREKSRFVILVLIFIAPYFFLTGIQKTINSINENTFSIATNTWINIEGSLIPEQKLQEAGYYNVFVRYIRSSEDPLQRELESKQRVIDYLKHTSLRDIFHHQAKQFVKLLNEPFIKNIGIGKNRWSNTSQLFVAVDIAITLSWLILIFGMVGSLLLCRHDILKIIIAGYLFYYVSALFLVGGNPRFFMQAIPFLSIFSALLLQKIIFRFNKVVVE